jgi:hypothetical protein
MQPKPAAGFAERPGNEHRVHAKNTPLSFQRLFNFFSKIFSAHIFLLSNMELEPISNLFSNIKSQLSSVPTSGFHIRSALASRKQLLLCAVSPKRAVGIRDIFTSSFLLLPFYFVCVWFVIKNGRGLQRSRARGAAVCRGKSLGNHAAVSPPSVHCAQCTLGGTQARGFAAPRLPAVSGFPLKEGKSPHSRYA